MKELNNKLNITPDDIEIDKELILKMRNDPKVKDFVVSIHTGAMGLQAMNLNTESFEILNDHFIIEYVMKTKDVAENFRTFEASAKELFETRKLLATYRKLIHEHRIQTIFPLLCKAGFFEYS